MVSDFNLWMDMTDKAKSLSTYVSLATGIISICIAIYLLVSRINEPAIRNHELNNTLTTYIRVHAEKTELINRNLIIILDGVKEDIETNKTDVDKIEDVVIKFKELNNNRYEKINDLIREL